MATAQKSSNPASDDSNLVPFEKAVEVKLVEGTKDTFSATLTSDWCNIANIGFGGLCVSLILAASRAYFATTHPSRSQPDPIHVTAQFLSAVPAGPLTIQVQPEKLGRNYSVVRVSLRTATTICTVAFVTQGNLATESGPNFETPKFELPDRAKCREVISKVFGTANPATKRCRIFCPPGGETPFWTPDLGRHRRDQWARLTDDDSRWDLLSLACIADWIPAMPLNYGYDKDMMGFLKTYGQSTISLTMEIRKDPKGAQWLLQRAVMNAAKNGRFDLDVKIIDEDGDLVASLTLDRETALRELNSKAWNLRQQLIQDIFQEEYREWFKTESLSVVRTVFTFTVSEDDILSSLRRVLLRRIDSFEVGVILVLETTESNTLLEDGSRAHNSQLGAGI
ncbi:hypothetical protein V500_08751 [Pseudogymnoascus sp. VKM F-4518 (FW-2643)]|nr:hypothetical protein V500_08751 [Pseudogymnoascus sp. VKM F-4518 (FW-2643)]